MLAGLAAARVSWLQISFNGRKMKHGQFPSFFLLVLLPSRSDYDVRRLA